MDYEKLIEQLKNLEACAYGYHINGEVLGMDCSDFEQVMVDAATAISTLQAENEKMRAELKSKVDLVFQQAKELERRHLLLQEQEAELEQVKRERDAAIQDLKKHRKYKCDCCYYADKQSRFPCTDCQSPISTYGDGWKWRGLDGRGLTWNG